MSLFINQKTINMLKKYVVMVVAVALFVGTVPTQVLFADETTPTEPTEVVAAAQVVGDHNDDGHPDNGNGNNKGKLTVNLQVVNNDGGTKTVADFPITLDGVAFTANTQTDVAYGAHTVAITVPASYTMTAFGGDCISSVVVISANDPQRTCDLVVDDNAVITIPVPPANPSPVTPSKTVTGSCFEPVLPQLPGDVNFDGNVNGEDHRLLALSYNASTGAQNFNADADFNKDGNVNFTDLVPLAQHFNEQTIAYTYYHNLGDADNSGYVDLVDNKILAATYNKNEGDAGYDARGDFTGDKKVNFADLVVLAQNYKKWLLVKCVPVVPTPTPSQTPSPSPSPTPVTPNNGGNGGVAPYTGGAGGGSSTGSTSTSGGQVLGASTSNVGCPAMLESYIKFGAANKLEDVVKLQSFLRNQMGMNVKITGTYDVQSLNAVNAFQLKYKTDVLKPWVAFGLPNEDTATGYVYKTTKHKINTLICPSAVIAAPKLP
jgi:hypothetical protein